jgi:hypothetical protein
MMVTSVQTHLALSQDLEAIPAVLLSMAFLLGFMVLLFSLQPV